MWIRINQKPLELPECATVAEALDAFGAKPPFAVALNLSFVHRQNYAATVLQPDDELEIVQPVAGG
jgi:sulfur carrier protein